MCEAGDEQTPKRRKQFPIWPGVVLILIGLAELLLGGKITATAMSLMGVLCLAGSIGPRRRG